MDKVVDEAFKGESDAPHLASAAETPAVCPRSSPSLSATDDKENSQSGQNDYKIKTQITLEIAKEDAFVPHKFPCVETPDGFKSTTQQASHKLTSTPPNRNFTTDDTGTLTNGSITSNNGLRTLNGNRSKPLMSGTLPTLDKSLTALQENTESLQEDAASTQDSKLSTIGTDCTKEINSELCVQCLVGSPASNPDKPPLSTPGSVSELVAAQTEMFKAVRDAEEQQKHYEDESVTPKKVFTIVLDIEPQDMQENKDVRPDVIRCFQGAVLYDAQSDTFKAVTDAQQRGKCREEVGVRPDEVSPEKKSGFFTTVIGPESDETDLKIHHLTSALSKSQTAESLPENPAASESTESVEVKTTSAKLSCKENPDASDLITNEVLKSSELCGRFVNQAETASPDVKQEQMTGFCHTQEQTMSSVVSTVGGDVLTETQIPAGDSKQWTAANTAQSTGTGRLEMAERENTEEEASEPDRPKSGHLKVPRRRVKAPPLIEECKLKVPASLEDVEVTQGQVNIKYILQILMQRFSTFIGLKPLKTKQCPLLIHQNLYH